MSIFSWVKENWITVGATIITTVATGGTNLVAMGIAFGAGYLLDADRQQRKQENEKLALASEAGKAVRGEVNSLQDKRNKVIQEAEELIQELNKHKSKLNDPNATKEEKDQAKRMIPIIQNQLDDKDKQVSDISKKIEDLIKNIPGINNQKGLGIDFNKVLIIGGTGLVLYLILKNDKER